MDILNRVVFGCGYKAALLLQNAHVGVAGIYSFVVPMVCNVLTAHVVNVVQKLVDNGYAAVFVYIKACKNCVAFGIYRHALYLIFLCTLYPYARVNVAAGLVEVVVFDVYVIGGV